MDGDGEEGSGGWMLSRLGWPVLLWQDLLSTCTEVKSNLKPTASSGQFRWKLTQASSVQIQYRLWTKLGQQAKQTLPWRYSLNDSFNSRIFLYSWEYYNLKTNISSSDLLNSAVTTVHCQEMLFPVQILNDRFYGVWYWAGKTTHDDPLC